MTRQTVSRGLLPGALVLVALMMASPAGALGVGAVAPHGDSAATSPSGPAMGHFLATNPCPARLQWLMACPNPTPASSSLKAVPTGSPAPTANGPYWKEVCGTGTCGLGEREDSMMAYDAADGYTVLFGGINSSSGLVFGDTWTFSNGTWTQIFPASSPPARFDGLMAYDPVDGYVVLFGGVSNTGCTVTYGDTWEFHAGQWAQLSLTTSPSPRFFPSFAWDALDNYMVLFGGVDCSNTYFSDTWQFSGGQWTALTPATSPSARFGAGFTWDDVDSYMVLFGGNAGGTDAGDTWSFSAGTWALLSPASAPSARALQDDQMVTDGGSPLLWGGYAFSTGSCLGDTWTFRAGTWAQVIPTSSPPAKGWGTMTNDPTVGTIDFGGYGCSGTDLGDTWVYVSGPHVSTPTALPAVPESGQPVTFNSTVLYAGQTPDTFWWSWSPARDLQCAPSTNLSLACTPLRTGNYSITAHIQDSTGSNGSATLQPFYVARGPMVSRPLANTTHVDVGQSVQFTTTLVFNASGGDVYSWSASGAGMGCPASSLLTLVCVPTAAGTYNVTARVTDLVGGSGWNVSRDITVAPIPAAGIPIAVPAPSVDVGQMVEFSANVSNGGAGGDQYLWSASPTSGLLCPASQSPHVTCLATAAGWYNVTLTVIDSNGGRGWGEVEYRVFALPSLHAPTPSPGSLDVGQSAVFSPGIGTPGSGGLKFDWNSSGTGLGCGSNTLVTYTCTPTTAGSYTVSVIANDSNGGEGRAVSAPFQVFALPAVSSPERSVASPAVQESVTFTSELLSGGSGGDLFTWSSSISSLVCATSKALADTCTASAPGSYRVTLTVTDSNGGTGSATTTTFTVTGPLQATASAVPSSGKASLTVTFSSSVWGGTAPYSYAWRFGDGPAGTSADANPTHVYTSKGNYQVELWVNDSSGNSVAVTVAVSVSAPESPTFFSSVPGGGLTVGLFLLLAVVVTLALIVLLRRRREPEPASGPFSSYSPGPTSGGSPGGDSPPPPA